MTKRAGYVFVAPFLIFFVLLFLLPLGYAGYLSLFKDQLVGGTVFAGLANYTRALTDPQLMQGVLRVGLFFLIQVPVMLAISLGAALAIDSGLLRAARVFRLGVFIPYAVPSVVAALMWGYLYGPSFGPLSRFGVDLLTGNLMLPALGNIVTWEFAGYNMIILYAALRTVPAERYEAAAVDGASPLRTAWHIKLPALRPALLLCLVFSVIGSFQLFAEPNLIQRLAPNVIHSSYTPNLYAYSLAFTSQQVNYAAAVSFLLGFVILVVSYAVLLTANRSRR
ncbi:carbohydrate ABC transporter permease [Actinoplanes sp. NPDC051513]|uniref:carbohydrate ABC transporter permease n=1 Tax=Actinoplanes sp. NPDC051513 TaxID=3363908 RepID=UPI00379831DA